MKPTVVTVTGNTGLDYIYFIPKWEAGTTLRASRVVQGMSGKPADCSWILAEMGITSLALGFAAGMTGEMVRQLMAGRGISTDFVPVEGESRRNLIIATEDGEAHTAITASTLIVSPAHVAALREKFIVALDDCELVVLGGTLPKGIKPEFYTDLIALAVERHIPVIFDASEPYLSAGLASHPTYVKPNRDELSQFIGKRVETVEEAFEAGRVLLDRCGTIPIISLGDQGGLAVLPDRAYRVPPLTVPVVNAAGAGDAVLAGLAASIFRHQPIEDGIRLGFAAATAVVTTEGTADCSLADIQRYAAQIEVLPYERV
ncbi:MAG TPA: 1-phosphofructokinase family hexose kinase [Phototrophicaceae bacterium]|nr:1-phosphofructokinase family hexose kinase [Phototrophicaceae bacterium]